MSGPCKKHLKVTIAAGGDRASVRGVAGRRCSAMRQVPGFRPGRAPRQLVEKRFRKQVAEQVKSIAADGLARADRRGLQAQSDHPAEARRRGDRAPRRRARCPSRWTSRSGPTSTSPTYKALTVKRPVKTITRGRRRGPAQALPGAVRRRSSPSSKGAPRSATTSPPTSRSTGRRPGSQRGQGDPVPAPAGAAVPGRQRSRRSARRSTGVKPGETSRGRGQARLGGRPIPTSAARRSRSTVQVHDLKQLRLPEVNPAFLELDRLRQPGRAARRRSARPSSGGSRPSSGRRSAARSSTP